MTGTLRHEFITSRPDHLDDGVLYVSMPYATAIHLCACGCGEEVVTPIARIGWQLQFDGESITLTPSIGNWRLPCRSHYWIRRNAIRWALDSGSESEAAPAPAQRASLTDRMRQWVSRRLSRR